MSKAPIDCPHCKERASKPERLIKLGVLWKLKKELGGTVMLGCPKCHRVYWQSAEERYGGR